MKKINSFSFQGVNGAYSEEAGSKMYPEAKSLPCSTFEEMFDQEIDYVLAGELGKLGKPTQIKDILTGEVLR